MNNTPLHWAVINNDLAEASRLKESLGDIDFVNDAGFTSLDLAFLLGRGECIRLLCPKFKPQIKMLLKTDKIVSHLTAGELLEKTGVAYSPTLHFSSFEDLERILHLFPRILDDSVHALGKDKQKEIFSCEIANVTVVWVNNALGYGVVTNRNLKKGDFIGEYTGWVRPVSRIMPWVNGYCLQYPTRWGAGRYVIDAKVYGNITRYINHKDLPNLEGRWALDRGLMHLLLFAADDIPRGAQLTLDYGNDYWENRVKY
ncbi:MAG: SET domain-containing protein-lysine N-methyltransferase [Parachlamydiales bacterium]|jgi:hypothetical protein